MSGRRDEWCSYVKVRRAVMSAALPGLAVWAALATSPAARGQELLREVGDFRSEVDRLRGLVATNFGSNDNTYVVPTTAQMDSFRTMVATLRAGDLARTAQLANAIDYDLVQWRDTGVAQPRTYFMLRERNVAATRKGWGTYVYNFGYTLDVQVQVPHVLYDQNTEDTGARLFQLSNPRCFCLFGSHRACNGVIGTRVGGISDPTWELTPFQPAHEAFMGANGRTVAWQVHGFGDGTPDDGQAFLADSMGGIASQHRFLDRSFETRGITAYVANDYATTNSNYPLNVEVNRTVTSTGTVTNVYGPSISWNAQQNPQGIYAGTEFSNSTFVHIELSSLWRGYGNGLTSTQAAANRQTIATAATEAMSSVTYTSNVWTGLGGNTRFDTTGNWAGSNPPTSGEDMIFGGTVGVTTYAAPTLVQHAFQVQSNRFVVWNSPVQGTFNAINTSTGSQRIWTLLGDGANNVAPLFWITPAMVNGTVTVSGSNTTAGGPPLVLRLGGNGAFRVDSPGATLRIDALITEVTDTSTGVTLAHTFEKTGAGTVLLNNTSNAFTGGVRLTQGTLQIADFRATGANRAAYYASHLIFNGGTLNYTGSSATLHANHGTFVSHETDGAFRVNSASTTVTYAGGIQGPGLLTKSGPGNLSLTGVASSYTFTGGVRLNQGTLQVSDLAQAGTSRSTTFASASALVFDGGTLHYTGASATLDPDSGTTLNTTSSGGAFTIASAAATVTYAGAIAGAGAFVKAGPGELALTADGSSYTYTGGMIVRGGSVSFADTRAIGQIPSLPTPQLILENNATARWLGGTVTAANARGLNLVGAGGTLSVTGSTSTYTWAGTVSGSGRLTKAGPGTLVLSNSNVLTGGVAVVEGTLSAGNAGNLGALPAAIDPDFLLLAGGRFFWTGSAAQTWDFTRGITITGSGSSVSSTGSSALSLFGNITGSGSLTKDGNFTLAANGSVTLGALTVAQGTVALTQDGMPAASLASISITAGAELDIARRGLVVRSSSQFAAVRSLILSAYNGGLSDGTGIGSSVIATQGLAYAVGYALNTFGYTTFLGTPTSANDVLVRLTYLGDTDLDGDVDNDDLARMIASTGSTWAQGDFNLDGTVNDTDIQLFWAGYAQQGGMIPVVPEPTLAAFLALPAALTRRTRRR